MYWSYESASFTISLLEVEIISWKNAFYFEKENSIFVYGVKEKSSFISSIWISIYWNNCIYCITLFQKWIVCMWLFEFLTLCSIVLITVVLKFLIFYRASPPTLFLFKSVWVIWRHFTQEQEREREQQQQQKACNFCCNCIKSVNSFGENLSLWVF